MYNNLAGMMTTPVIEASPTLFIKTNTVVEIKEGIATVYAYEGDVTARVKFDFSDNEDFNTKHEGILEKVVEAINEHYQSAEVDKAFHALKEKRWDD